MLLPALGPPRPTVDPQPPSRTEPNLRSQRLGRVLVTGGAGFIGSELSHVLAERADRWVVLDNLHPQVHARRQRPARLHAGAELVEGDVTCPADVDAVVAELRPDVVVHLAAETGTAQSLDESTRHGLVNVVGTTVLLDAMTKAGVVPGHLVLTSSRAVYGEGLWRRRDGSTYLPGLRTHSDLEAGRWDHEGEPVAHSVAGSEPAPINVYGATKLAQEHILAAWAGARDTALTVLRLQNVYGPGQSLTNSYTGIVALFSRLARQGDVIPLYEDGEITRDFVYIADVASALATVIESPGVGVRRFDVGSGEATTIRGLAQLVADLHGAPAPEVTGQFRDGDVRHAASQRDAGLVALGWNPEWELSRGVAALQDWIAAEEAAVQSR